MQTKARIADLWPAFFIAWIDRLVEMTKANRNWDTAAEKTSVLQTLDQARQAYVRLLK